MWNSNRIAGVFIGCAIIAGGVACHQIAATAPDAPAAAVAAADDGPVGADPKINANFLSPDLDVDAWTQRFEGESREVYRAREALIAAVGIEPGTTVADIGTGSGLFIKYLADAVGPSGHIIATDIAPRFLENAARRAADAGLGNVRTALGSATTTGLAPASIDMAWICDVYHHFEDPAAILADLRRALKPGGRVVIIDFHRIVGQSSDFILGHVRANRETVIAELESAGFRRLPDVATPFLVENYLVIFE